MTILLLALLVIHNAIPRNISVINLGNFEIGSFGFIDIGTLVFYSSQKLVLGILSIIWLIFNPYWWRWAILSPIIFYSYQFWESFQSTYEIESAGNLSVFPLVFLKIGGVFLLSRVIRRISINLDYKAFLEAELDKSLGELSREASRNLSKIPHPEYT